MPDTMMETATRIPDVLQDAILRTTDTSPFGRKVRIALAMAGWTDVVRCVSSSPIDPADPLRIDNPLGKMPCLVLSDGRKIFDSPVILEFLDGFCGGLFIPSSFDVRIASLREQALADGLTDAAMLMGSERMFHEAGQVSERWLAHQRGKVERALQAFSEAPPALDIPAIGAISLAASLGYLDWRKPVDWRVAFPRLVEWLEAFGRCVPAYEATRADY